jgi:hypothetical protein
MSGKRHAEDDHMTGNAEPSDDSDFMSELLRLGPNMEILTLKAHLWIEARLRGLLSVRLGIDEAGLPRLSFAQLAALACCGLKSPLAEQLTLINKIRNAYAHERRPPSQLERIRRLVAADL